MQTEITNTNYFTKTSKDFSNHNNLRRKQGKWQGRAAFRVCDEWKRRGSSGTRLWQIWKRNGSREHDGVDGEVNDGVTQSGEREWAAILRRTSFGIALMQRKKGGRAKIQR